MFRKLKWKPDTSITRHALLREVLRDKGYTWKEVENKSKREPLSIAYAPREAKDDDSDDNDDDDLSASLSRYIVVLEFF